MVKRLFDIAASTLLLIGTAPILGVVLGLTRFTSGEPVLFKQVRPGKGGKLFVLYKVRTMRTASDVTSARSEAARVTALGEHLRATGLDELPQLYNVLKGDMSLVGPRPLLPEYLALYSREQNVRHDVRPGMTGLAQVSGRSGQAWEQQFETDVWYVRNRTLLLDLRILIRTVGVVVSRDSSHADPSLRPPFTNSQ